MELCWQKEAVGSYYATDTSGRVVAIARKTEPKVWEVKVQGNHRVRRGTTYGQAREIAARVLEDQRWESIRAEDLSEGDAVRFIDAETTLAAVVQISGCHDGLSVSYVMGDSKRYLGTFYPDSQFERPRKPEPAEDTALESVEEPSAVELCGKRRPGWEQEGPGRHRLPCLLPARHGGLHRDAVRAEWLESEAGQVIGLRPFTAIVDLIAGTGRLLTSPPASDDLFLSEDGASLHDSLCADTLRRLLPLGVEALDGADGRLSLKGFSDDGRKVFSLCASDCITAEPDFEEGATCTEAHREAVGL